MTDLPGSASANTNNQPPLTTGVNTDTNKTSAVTTQSGITHKELEPPAAYELEAVELMPDVELTPELEKIGVEKLSEAIELPADVQKLGVQAVGSAQPVTSTTPTLPLTDDQINQGLHVQIISSFRWLAEWCVRQLKKMHVHLKRTHGKIIRVDD